MTILEARTKLKSGVSYMDKLTQIKDSLHQYIYSKHNAMTSQVTKCLDQRPLTLLGRGAPVKWHGVRDDVHLTGVPHFIATRSHVRGLLVEKITNLIIYLYVYHYMLEVYSFIHSALFIV